MVVGKIYHIEHFGLAFSVPRKVLKDRFDYSVEPDEPAHVDPDLNQDDLYDEDQFYRESEAIPPAPKLHRELSKSVSGGIGDFPTIEPAPSSVNPPQRAREGNHHLEGMCIIVVHN